MRTRLTAEERADRRVLWTVGVIAATGGALVLSVFGLAAWVIVRVTLHFT